MAPLLIGVTGKLDLKGADEAVRAALSLAFDRLDARCPGTPKVLLSALAKGADTVAAEAALARPGWSVVAPLPFSADLYLEDFDAAAGARLRGLLANPRVRALVVEPLRKRDGGKPFSDPELSRSSEDGSARTDHYEQVGLFIAERAAILIAVMEAAEPPGKIGGSARIVHHRLTGELDADTIRVVRRSEVLLEPPRLADRHTGPVWVVDLDRLDRNPGAPADALLVWNPGDAGPAPLGAKPATTLSLTLADGVEGFNRRVSRLSGPAWKALEARAGPHRGDAASQLRRLRIGLSLVQGEMIRRVRRSIRQLAWLSLATILMFEIYVDLGSRDFYLDLDRFAWAPLACVAYIVLLLAAVFIYWHAGRQRWQRIAEDYRAAAEALRVQLAWWESGLTGRDDRIRAVLPARRARLGAAAQDLRRSADGRVRALLRQAGSRPRRGDGLGGRRSAVLRRSHCRTAPGTGGRGRRQLVLFRRQPRRRAQPAVHPGVQRHLAVFRAPRRPERPAPLAAPGRRGGLDRRPAARRHPGARYPPRSAKPIRIPSGPRRRCGRRGSPPA